MTTLAVLGLPYNCAVTVMWRANGSTVNVLVGQKYSGMIRQVQKTLHSWWKEKIAKPISKIDFSVKHVYREHNQESDHWANIGAQGQRKIVLDRCDNSESWKAVKGHWDGSFKDNGKR